MGVNFFFRKIGHEGGGVRGLRVCGRKKSRSSFLNISLIINRTRSAGPEKLQLIEATQQTWFLTRAAEISVVKMAKSYYETSCLLYCHTLNVPIQCNLT